MWSLALLSFAELFLCENICSQRYVDLKTVSTANATFLRQLNFSGRDIQQVKMQVPWSCPAVVSSCRQNLVTRSEPLSSIRGITSCVSSQSLRDKSSSCHQSCRFWSRKRTLAHTFWKSSNIHEKYDIHNTLHVLKFWIIYRATEESLLNILVTVNGFPVAFFAVAKSLLACHTWTQNIWWIKPCLPHPWKFCHVLSQTLNVRH